MLKGVLIEESLEDAGVLDGLAVINKEVVDIDNAAEGQPTTWTLHYFELAEGGAAEFAKKLQKALKPGKWYVDCKSEQEVYVVFKDKVFHYQRSDEAGKQMAVSYARSLNIPESQLDW